MTVIIEMESEMYLFHQLQSSFEAVFLSGIWSAPKKSTVNSQNSS